MFEVPRVRDAEDPDRELVVVGRQRLAKLVLRPDEELALDRFAVFRLAVGVGGRVEGVLGRGHVAQHVVGGLAGHTGQQRVAGQPVGQGVGAEQVGLVVEHLLEVGNEPPAVHRSSGGSRLRPGRGCRRGPSRAA